MRCAGRRFGANGQCHRGLGGMTAFSDRLKKLAVSMTEMQDTPVLQNRMLQGSANASPSKVRMAHELLAQLQQQKSNCTQPRLAPAAMPQMNAMPQMKKSWAEPARPIISAQAVGPQTTNVSQQEHTQDVQPPRISEHEIMEATPVRFPRTLLCSQCSLLCSHLLSKHLQPA
jgi:hypothetical protein